MWYNKEDSETIYFDRRKGPIFIRTRNITRVKGEIKPDVLGVWQYLPFQDNIYNLALFDPPHEIGDYETAVKHRHSVYSQLYMTLQPQVWIKDLFNATRELARVVKPGGFIIFKWNDRARPLKRVVALFPSIAKPLFFNQIKNSNRSTTFWVVFRKDVENP